MTEVLQTLLNEECYSRDGDKEIVEYGSSTIAMKA